MKAYTFKYKGLWIGGVIIVIAENEIQAFEIARNGLGECFKNDKIVLVSESDISVGIVLYNYDGDY